MNYSCFKVKTFG